MYLSFRQSQFETEVFARDSSPCRWFDMGSQCKSVTLVNLGLRLSFEPAFYCAAETDQDMFVSLTPT